MGVFMVRPWAAGLIIATAATAAEATAPSSVTFHKDVLPILESNCQSCHRPGQVAPMSFLTYKEVRPWAKAIKTAVALRKMPPWFADPRYGHFSNDRSLKQSEIDTLVAWAIKVHLRATPKMRPHANSGRREAGRSNRTSFLTDLSSRFPRLV